MIILSDPNFKPPSYGEIILRDRSYYIDKGFSNAEVDKLKATVAAELFTGLKTLDEVEEDSKSDEFQKITFGCPCLDELTDGGIPVQGITEIYGAPGVGKTQVCLQLSLTVQRSRFFGGLNKGCAYICTVKEFPIKRLTQLADHIQSARAEDPLTNIWIVQATELVDIKILWFL